MRSNKKVTAWIREDIKVVLLGIAEKRKMRLQDAHEHVLRVGLKRMGIEPPK